MGCHAMDAVTHPMEAVVADVERHFVPVKLESGKHPDISRRMNVRWLPGLVVATPDERPAHTVIGYLPAADLVTELAFGRAIVAMGDKRYGEAHALFQTVAETDGAERAPEACFWWGISRYRHTKDFQGSVAAPWGRILERWP